jgi:mono/diheme cytochrome c family protein
MRPTLLPRLLAAATVIAAAFGAGVASASGAAPRATSDAARPHALGADTTGAYTEEQAERGVAVWKAVCVECHELDDMTNADFRLEWNGKTLYALYDLIRTTMPDENPGTLTREQYLDVTAYVLKLNKLPAGPAEFTGDSTAASAVVLRLP